MKKILFYYDESDHSRKINKQTIDAFNYGANFIAAIIGFENEKKGLILEKYLSFEEKHKINRNVTELKSNTIKTEQLKYGFASLNKSNIPLLEEYLTFVISYDLSIYISVINKIEYVINQLFAKYENNIFVDSDYIRYSIVKTISVYKPDNVIDSIYRNDGSFISELKIFINEQLEFNEDKEHKKLENNIFKELLILLKGYNSRFLIDWNYKISFDGFLQYLNEKSRPAYELTIDREGYGKTLESAKSVGLLNVTEEDSVNSPGIRIADMLAGIISKFIKSIDNDLEYKTKDEMKRLKYFSEKWFILDDRKLKLYKSLHHIVNVQKNAWFKTYSGNYADIFISFICILNYFAGFKDITGFNKVSLNEHQQKLNSFVVNKLQDHFMKMKSKLPIEFVSSDNTEYYFNQKGAKTFFDYNKHEMLPINRVTNLKQKPSVYEVLSVGFFGHMEHPCVTVKIDQEPVCYLIPKQLTEWAVNCVGIANLGQNVFPSHVEFRWLNNKFYADIL